MEYALGSLLALFLSLGYTKVKCQSLSTRIYNLEEVVKNEFDNRNKCQRRIELIEKRLDDSDKELLQKVMTTMMPIAKAVNKLNTEVGIR